MSHHYSGPDYGFPHGDARLDLTDLYAFPKPGDAGKSILIKITFRSKGPNPIYNWVTGPSQSGFIPYVGQENSNRNPSSGRYWHGFGRRFSGRRL
jgi:hypothetical protein